MTHQGRSASETTASRGDWYEARLRGTPYLESRVKKAHVIAELCREQFETARRIGDLGSGTGIVKKTLEVEFDKPIFGFELALDPIVERDRMVRADILRLPTADRAFDFLILNHVYEHVADHGRLFGEAYRVLAPGGQAFVSAGSRYALMEPHYRLPFLSWLPRGAANAYLRVSGRGARYDGIRFLGYRPLVSTMRRPGFAVRDITRRAIDDLIASTWGPGWEKVWASLRAAPPSVRDTALRALSPQWFFLLQKPT